MAAALVNRFSNILRNVTINNHFTRRGYAAPTTSSISSRITLNDGTAIPHFGLGCYLMQDADALKAVEFALENGYRLIDTAEFYGNESMCGKAVRESDLTREDVFIVSKLMGNHHGKKATTNAFKDSLKRLKLDYMDMYIIQSPRGGRVLESYDTLLRLKEDGFVRSIGVGNFDVPHIEALVASGRPLPAVNQIEFHCFLPQPNVIKVCQENNITVMGYSPTAQMSQHADPLLQEIAKRAGRSIAQVMIRFCIQSGVITTPKSRNPVRILENADVFDWELSEQDMADISTFKTHRVTMDWSSVPWSG